MNSRKIILTFILLLSSFVLGAWEEIPTFHVNNITVDDGLSDNTVNCFYVDEFGFVWVGTNFGLNRCEDHSIKKITRDVYPDLTDNMIFQICGDRTGHLFLLTNSGIFLYDIEQDTFTLMTTKKYFSIEFNQGCLWAVNKKNIICYDPLTFHELKKITVKDDDSTVNLRKIKFFKDGRLVVGGVSKVYILDPDNGNVLHMESAYFSNDILIDSEDNALISMRENGIMKIRPDYTTEIYKHDQSEFSDNYNNVRSVCQLTQYTFAIGSFGGFSILDIRDGRFHKVNLYQKYDGDSQISIRNMTFDSSGILWLATYYNGIYFYNLNSQHNIHYYFSDSIRPSNAHFLSTSEDSSTNLWFCSSSSGLYCLDRARGSIEKIKSPELEYTKCCYADSLENCMWVGTVDSGVSKVDLSTGQVESIFPVAGRFRVRNIVKIAPLNESELLLATNVGFLIMDKQSYSIRRLDNKITSQIWDMEIFGDNIWSVTTKNVCRYNMQTNSVKIYSSSDLGCESNYIFNSVYKDVYGRLWFGSNGDGIFLYEDQSSRFIRFRIPDNGSSQNIMDFCDDDHDSMFVATDDALYSFDFSQEIFSRILQVRVNKSGLFRSGSTDELIICSANDILSFKIADHEETLVPPVVAITDVKVNGRIVKPGDATGILKKSPLYQDHFDIKSVYSDIDFRVSKPVSPSSSKYSLEYKLSPGSGLYRRVPKDMLISFSNLKQGNYELQVRAVPSDADSEFLHKTISFNIVPPFYKRTWFILMCFLLVLIIIMIFIFLFFKKMELQVELDKKIQEKVYSENLNQARLDYFTSISHELRTPVTLINGLTETLASQWEMLKENKSRDIINSIHSNSSRLKLLVDEVIDFRKIQQDCLKLNFNVQNISTMTRRVYDLFIQYAKVRKIQYTLSVENQEVYVDMDSTQLEKVLYNIVSNAFKFTRDSIKISQVVDHGMVRIEVLDNGVGISPEDLNYVFEPYNNVNKSISSGGSGIGMAFSKSIVDLHSGNITVDSKQGEWTLFSVSIPMSDKSTGTTSDDSRDNYTAPAYLAYVQEDTSLVDDSAILGKNILLVEDNSDIRYMISNYLSSYFDVKTASNGAEGLTYIESNNVDLIISDVMMPVMSGIDMCNRIKSNEATSHIPVILISAYTSDSDVIAGLGSGADDYITKPFSLEVLLCKVRNIIRAREYIQQQYKIDDKVDVKMLVTADSDKELILKAEAIINAHISDNSFSIASFSHEMGLSRTYLFTKIKGITGQTPNEMILNHRLKLAARRLIAEKDIKITDIAYECGFSAHSYFNKCFKKLYGLTPSQFRQNH